MVMTCDGDVECSEEQRLCGVCGFSEERKRNE
jgi:hypothetical protein